ncbi:genetic competence negative regulator [Bacillus sp. J33]|uniref:genetic competence negative regulator n=1 Tax=Bacillus sp. J33 TaxID=935836 RepID=UPI00047C507E|nr:genetic competence negative regulator [Bacillus sp. J33]
MRLERLNYNKIKIFLTLDDLTDRGLTKEDVWKDSLKWHQLFHEMLEEVSEEYGVDIQGSVAVEIFSMQAQGMVMIVTMEDHQDEELLEDGFIEMQVTVDGSEEVLFEFQDIEDVIQMAKRLDLVNIDKGSLYSYKERYYYHSNDMSPEDIHRAVAILAEFGNPSFTSLHLIHEYGKIIIKDKAVKKLVRYFS